jgi:hypothetical protein
MKPARLYCVIACLCSCFSALHDVAAAQARRIDLRSMQSQNRRVVLSTSGAKAVEPSSSSLELKPAEILIERLPGRVIKLAGSDPALTRPGQLPGQELPFRLYAVGAQGARLDLTVVADIDGRGLKFSDEEPVFIGRIFIGIIDKLHPGSQQTLPVPVNLQVTSKADKVEPDVLILNHINLPYVPVTIKARTPADPVTVSIRPSFDLDPMDLELKVIRPSLHVSPSPQAIFGFGLEEASIIVRAEELAYHGDIPLALTATKGTLSKIEATLGKTGTVTSKIRSGSMGTAKIRAEASGFTSGETILIYTFPWEFLLAASGGGIVGTLAKKTFTRKGIVAGIALGLLGGVAYAVGLNLTGFAINVTAGAAVTFIAAGLVAYFGLKAAAPKR